MPDSPHSCSFRLDTGKKTIAALASLWREVSETPSDQGIQGGKELIREHEQINLRTFSALVPKADTPWPLSGVCLELNEAKSPASRSVDY